MSTDNRFPVTLIGIFAGFMLGFTVTESWPKGMGSVDPIFTGVLLTLFGIVALGVLLYQLITTENKP